MCVSHILLDCIFVHLAQTCQRLPHERVHLLNSACVFWEESLSMTFVFSYLTEVIQTFMASGRQRWPSALVDYAESLEVETSCAVSVLSNWTIASQRWQPSSFATLVQHFLTLPQNEIKDQQLRWRFRRSGTLSGGRRCQKKKEISTLLQDVGGGKINVLCFKTRANS